MPYSFLVHSQFLSAHNNNDMSTNESKRLHVNTTTIFEYVGAQIEIGQFKLNSGRKTQSENEVKPAKTGRNKSKAIVTISLLVCVKKANTHTHRNVAMEDVADIGCYAYCVTSYIFHIKTLIHYFCSSFTSFHCRHLRLQHSKIFPINILHHMQH